MSVGDADTWFNGGQSQPDNIYPSDHSSSVFYFARTINMTSSDGCLYVGWQCTDPNWTSFPWEKRNEEDICEYGDWSKPNEIKWIGEYIDRSIDPTGGNYILFTNNQYGYCYDLGCDET